MMKTLLRFAIATCLAAGICAYAQTASTDAEKPIKKEKDPFDDTRTSDIGIYCKLTEDIKKEKHGNPSYKAMLIEDYVIKRKVLLKKGEILTGRLAGSYENPSLSIYIPNSLNVKGEPDNPLCLGTYTVDRQGKWPNENNEADFKAGAKFMAKIGSAEPESTGFYLRAFNPQKYAQLKKMMDGALDKQPHSYSP